MTLKNSYVVLASLCFSVAAHADEMHWIPSCGYFISVSAGPGWANPGKTQTIALEPDVIKTYIPQNLANSHVLGDGEIFLGIQKSYFSHIQSQLGLDFYVSSAAKLKGNILEDGDPNFQNYAYHYKVSHEHIAVKTKWIFENNVNINPYISGSIGAGFNRSYGYTITPLISQEIPAPPFLSNTKTALSYSLGVGFQQNINQHFAISLGYQLVSWGKSNLNRADEQTSGKGLRLNNLYTQNAEFNISYFL